MRSETLLPKFPQKIFTDHSSGILQPKNGGPKAGDIAPLFHCYRPTVKVFILGVFHNVISSFSCRAESVKCKINVGTGEAIPKQPLSAASLRLLDEFGERYRIGFLYRRVCILEYIAR